MSGALYAAAAPVLAAARALQQGIYSNDPVQGIFQGTLCPLRRDPDKIHTFPEPVIIS